MTDLSVILDQLAAYYSYFSTVLRNYFALVMSNTKFEIEMPENRCRNFEYQHSPGGLSNEDEYPSYVHVYPRLSTYEEKCCPKKLPNYEIDRRALSLSFGNNSSRHTNNNDQGYFIASDGLPTLSDLVGITDRHQSEYFSLQKNGHCGPENVSSELKCLKVAIQVGDDENTYKKENPTFKRFLQGDDIEGSVTISNKSLSKLPYTACLVTLVGYISVKSGQKKRIIHRFLSMIDYDASNSLSNLDNTSGPAIEDARNSDLFKEKKKRYIEPSTSCRKSFKFRLPERLVSCACREHNLQQHCSLLPTFDFFKKSPSAILRWFKKSICSINNGTGENKRLGCPSSEASISYCIEAKIIGELADYQEYLYTEYRAIEKKLFTRLINIDKTFVTVQVLPRRNLDRELCGRQSKVIYNDLLQRARIKSQKNRPIEKPTPDGEKQLYKRDRIVSISQQNLEDYNYRNSKVLTDLFSKLSNSIGVIRTTMPAMNLNISPVPPYMYTDINDTTLPPFLLRFPIYLEFSPSCSNSSCTLPKISNVSFEMVALTYISRKLPIPIVVTYDVLFGEKKITDSKSYDPFEENITKPFRLLLSNMALLRKEDCHLMLDLRCLATMEYKYQYIPVPNLGEKINGISKQVTSTPWERTNPKDNIFHKTVNIDIITQQMKHTLAKLQWVPEFQSCFIGRMYFCKIKFKISKARDITINLPLTISGA